MRKEIKFFFPKSTLSFPNFFSFFQWQRNQVLLLLSKIQNNMRPSSSSNTRKSIFTLDDEILFLNRFLDYKSETGQNTMTDYTLFYNSFKELLSVKPTKKQLRKRIWKLKQKYEKMKKEENQKFPPRRIWEENIWPFSHDLGTRQRIKEGK